MDGFHCGRGHKEASTQCSVGTFVALQAQKQEGKICLQHNISVVVKMVSRWNDCRVGWQLMFNVCKYKVMHTVERSNPTFSDKVMGPELIAITCVCMSMM